MEATDVDNYVRISTHTLTWSVTGVFAIFVKFFTNFNSHAHVERDHFASGLTNEQLNFNSHAHVERDNFRLAYIRRYDDFNSHAHVERDIHDSTTIYSIY